MLAFKQFEGKKISLLYYKFIYVGINAFVLSIGLHKLYGVGLLPFSPSDWIDLIPRQTVYIFLDLCNMKTFNVKQTEIAVDVKL